MRNNLHSQNITELVLDLKEGEYEIGVVREPHPVVTNMSKHNGYERARTAVRVNKSPYQYDIQFNPALISETTYDAVRINDFVLTGNVLMLKMSGVSGFIIFADKLVVSKYII